MSILLSPYIPQKRPYSQKELFKMHIDILNEFKLTEEFTNICEKHIYYKKESVSKNYKYSKSCLACKKLKQMKENEQRQVDTMINEYNEKFSTFPEKLTYDLIDLENVYYKWLYRE